MQIKSEIVLLISITIMITGLGMSSTTLTLTAYGQDIVVTGGLCAEGHECSCTPASGVFHDHTTGVNINTGCGGEAQLQSGAGLCEEGHECTGTNGVFHDITTGISLANAC